MDGGIVKLFIHRRVIVNNEINFKTSVTQCRFLLCKSSVLSISVRKTIPYKLPSNQNSGLLAVSSSDI